MKQTRKHSKKRRGAKQSNYPERYCMRIPRTVGSDILNLTKFERRALANKMRASLASALKKFPSHEN